MSEINKMMAIPDEMLNSIVGGVLSDYTRESFRTVSRQLKGCGYPFRNAMDWLREQTAGYRFSDEDWQEIEEIVRSVYQE